MPLFSPLDLAPYANASRQAEPGRWHPAFAEALADVPGGELRYWGVPFGVAGRATTGGDEALSAPCWVLLGAGGHGAPVTIALDSPERDAAGSPSYLVFLHVCGLPASAPESDTLPQTLLHL